MQLFSIFILHLAPPICCQCHVLNLKTCQAYWPMDTRNVLLSHMSYSELASDSEGNLLPCAVGEECRLTKWWAAKGTKDMPQPSQLEKRAKTWQNMAKHGKTWQNLTKTHRKLVPSDQLLKLDGDLKVAHPERLKTCLLKSWYPGQRKKSRGSFGYLGAFVIS